MNESVTQQHNFGCGAACVAFVTGMPYRQVVKNLGEDKACRKGFWCKELKAMLGENNLQYEVKYVNTKMQKSIYANGVIVFTKRSHLYPHGHYLTYYNGKWMDPWLNWPVDTTIENAISGFRKRLPGQPQYALMPKHLL